MSIDARHGSRLAPPWATSIALPRSLGSLRHSGSTPPRASRDSHSAACSSGDIADGERIRAPLRKFGRPIADVIGPQPFASWQTALDPLQTPGMRNYWKSHDFLDIDDRLIDVLVDFARRLPDPNSEI